MNLMSDQKYNSENNFEGLKKFQGQYKRKEDDTFKDLKGKKFS